MPTLDAKFTYDINTLILTYQKMGWEGFGTCWGDRNIRWGIHIVNFVLYKIAGTNPLSWHIVTSVLHATNALLLFALIESVLCYFEFKKPINQIAFFASILFLLSPFHTETIVWGATLFYIYFATLTLLILLFYIYYLKAFDIKWLLLILLLFCFQLVTFEIFFITPILLVVVTVFNIHLSVKTIQLKRIFLPLFLPILVLTVGYFLVNLYRMDALVGHYGVQTHLNFSPSILVPNFSKFLLRFMGLHLFFDYPTRDGVYTMLGNTLGLIIQGLLYAFVALLLSYFFIKKQSKSSLVIALFTLFFSISIFPFLNLSVCFNKDIEQDRYLYLSALFFYPLLSIVTFSIAKRAAPFSLALFLFIMLFFLQKRIAVWHEVGKIHSSLVSSFRWQDASRVFILANADNYQGAYMMRDMPQSAFCEMLEVQRNIKIADKTHTLLQYNMNSASDSCIVAIIDSTRLRFEFRQWGNWFWYKSFGASSYDSLLYKVQIDEWNHSFEATFLDKKEGDVYIYQRKGEWVAIENF
jgi:hypothetical protein